MRPPLYRSARSSTVIVVMLTLTAMLTTMHLSAQALEDTQTGRTFVIAFPDTVGNLTDPRHPSLLRDTFALYLYSDVDNVCVITGVNYERSESLRARQFTTVYLDDVEHASSSITVLESGTASRSTFRIEARDPMMVICYFATKFGAEAWAPLPVERWGREYVAAALPGDNALDLVFLTPSYWEWGMHPAPGRIIVLSSTDNTSVRITSAAYPHSSAPTTIVLHRDEAYVFDSYVDPRLYYDSVQADLGGTMISASHPVGVISGNTRAPANYQNGNLSSYTRNSMRNTLFESVSPVEQHGLEFVVTPTCDTHRYRGARRREGDREYEQVRVFSAGPELARWELRGDFCRDDSTFKTARLLNAGDYFDARAAVYLRSDHPGQAMLVSEPVKSTSESYWYEAFQSSNYHTWSTYMAELVPREQWVSYAPFVTPAYPDSMEHFVNVVADSVSAAHIRWSDGEAFVFDQGAIKGTSLVWGTMKLASGKQYVLHATDGGRFTGTVYGLRHGFEAYRPTRETYNHYHETTALSYGYALAPARRQLREPSYVGDDGGATTSTIALAVQTDASSRVWIRYAANAWSPVRIEIVDMIGRMVTVLLDRPSTNFGEMHFDAASLAPGAYICRLVAENRTTSKLFSIAR